MAHYAELKKMNIGVIYGGQSSEREVSLKSGERVYQALQSKGYAVFKINLDKDIVEILKKKKIDFAYIILHGCPGEDGTIQGLLELLSIPYTGSGVLGSAISMNKIITKQLFIYNKISTPAFSIIKEKIDFQEIEKLGEPLIFKPFAEGSSVGVIKFKTFNEFKNKINELIDVYKYGIVEKFISGKNITIGVLEGKDYIKALPILELVPENEFYDFEAKYTKGKTKFIVPAIMDEELTKKSTRYCN